MKEDTLGILHLRCDVGLNRNITTFILPSQIWNYKSRCPLLLLYSLFWYLNNTYLSICC